MLSRQVLPGGKEVFFCPSDRFYLGEFSKAFNTMTAQLKERENALKQEAQREMAAAQQDLLEHSPDAYRLPGACKFHNFTPRSGRSAT